MQCWIYRTYMDIHSTIVFDWGETHTRQKARSKATMTTVGDSFELSEWFNNVSGKGGGASSKLDRKSAKVSYASDEHAPDPSVCFMCHLPNPVWTSSDKVKKAPPVPVCSEGCEARYLESKGLRPVKKDKKRRPSEDGNETNNEDTNSPEEMDMEHCFVCERPNPEYMSTNSMKNIPSVPVCGVECEAEHLKLKGKKKKSEKSNSNSSSSSSKRPKRGESSVTKASSEGEDVKRSLSFLEDHLLENDDSKGYKSWWLRALTFYDFVYQRHAMWHRCVLALDSRLVGSI